MNILQRKLQHRRRKTKQKQKTICARHQYTQTLKCRPSDKNEVLQLIAIYINTSVHSI